MFENPKTESIAEIEDFAVYSFFEQDLKLTKKIVRQIVFLQAARKIILWPNLNMAQN